MNLENFDKARSLNTERHEIERELKIWETDLTSVGNLAYLQSWNSKHPAELKSKVANEIFIGFRTSAINSLRLRLVDIGQEFSAL